LSTTVKGNSPSGALEQMLETVKTRAEELVANNEPPLTYKGSDSLYWEMAYTSAQDSYVELATRRFTIKRNDVLHKIRIFPHLIDNSPLLNYLQ
jgi:hypothetical protein